jgi:isopenicillin N synthase-like dioxygenase
VIGTAIRTLTAADLAAVRRPDDAAVAELMHSLRTGFVYVRHDLRDGLVDEAYAMLARLFALPTEDKVALTPPDALDNAGYRGLSSERAEGATVADWKETFQWCTWLPAGHPLRTRFPHRYPEPRFPEEQVPGIAELLGELRLAMLDCQRVVMRAIAVGLGAAAEIADDLMVDADVVTRGLHYPPLPSAGSTTWADEHVDINLITVLPPATAPGLEVLTEDGWVGADPAPGHLVLNTGAMLERLTNGAVPAGIHRVRPPDAGTERYSIAQFCHPSPWTVLAPLAVTVTGEAPQRYAAYQAAELLERTLWAIRAPAPVAT